MTKILRFQNSWIKKASILITKFHYLYCFLLIMNDDDGDELPPDNNNQQEETEPTQLYEHEDVPAVTANEGQPAAASSSSSSSSSSSAALPSPSNADTRTPRVPSRGAALGGQIPGSARSVQSMQSQGSGLGGHGDLFGAAPSQDSSQLSHLSAAGSSSQSQLLASGTQHRSSSHGPREVVQGTPRTPSNAFNSQHASAAPTPYSAIAIGSLHATPSSIVSARQVTQAA